MAEHKINAKEFIFLGNGLPLYEPDSLDSMTEPVLAMLVIISVVWRISRLFNILSPQDDPVNYRGVPDGFVPLDKRYEGIRYRTPLSSGVRNSASVRCIDAGAVVGYVIICRLTPTWILQGGSGTDDQALLLQNTRCRPSHAALLIKISRTDKTRDRTSTSSPSTCSDAIILGFASPSLRSIVT